MLAIVPLALPAAALAQVPDYDFQWATITHPGNAAFTGPTPGGSIPPRGRVDHVYRIAKMEVTSAQWMEFANAVSQMGGDYRVGEDAAGGYTEVGTYPNGLPRYALHALPGAGLLPVQGISWGNAARYCNWLHSGKQMSLAALQSGAYDMSTYGPAVDPATGNNIRTDPLTHLPGARFWIPTSDEWIKAAHFDPNRHGLGQPGYWQYPTTSDAAPVIGPESEGGQTNAGYSNYSDIPTFLLGAHPGTTSPWGLLDLSGGAAEWNEDAYDASRLSRTYDGSYAPIRLNPDPDPAFFDLIYTWNGYSPSGSGGVIGLRIASAVPAPSGGGLVIIGTGVVIVRKRRTE